MEPIAAGKTHQVVSDEGELRVASSDVVHEVVVRLASRASL